MHIFCPDKHKISRQAIYAPGCSSIIGAIRSSNTITQYVLRPLIELQGLDYRVESLDGNQRTNERFKHWGKLLQTRSNMVLLTDKFKTFLFIRYLKVKEMINFTITLLLFELAAVPLETLEQKHLNDGNQTYLILNDFGQVRPPVLFSWPFQEGISRKAF